MPRPQQSPTKRRVPRASTKVPAGCAAIALVLAAAACSNGEAPTTLANSDAMDPGGILFITQVEAPAAQMQALFEGPVVADEAGCLRLSSPDPSTVIWPRGFSLDGSDVRSERGERVGRIGGSFRLSGGEVPMHAGLGFPETEMQAIQARCPGKFWYTGQAAR